MKDLMQHMEVHYRNYICPVCGAGFINRGSLNKHEVVHTKEIRQYACKHCKKEFSHEWKRRRHVKSVHEGVDEKRHVCQMCKGRFKTYYMRAQHMIQAHNVKPLPCELCDKTFPIRPMLALHHRKEHMKEKQYECVVCKIRFFEKNKLVSHQIIHTGEKNFSCDVCGKAFARRKTLTTHLKTHGSVINRSK
ncbi:unnamed protein product [Plutella xylostella]|uniref:(diamondback moth) hypothetical protein n=1 Tax=Plutella xylostella TaxID=51655 RepID=A0A8S4DWM9_PLUXY|nr:unnamed protein product [Plutella xylostella]